MYLSKIRLQNFRSYDDFSVSFDPGVTIITGKNGSGKTNLLEAIYLLCRGKSFRDSDEYITAHGKAWWKVSGTYHDQAREARYDQGEKSFVVHGRPVKRLSTTTILPVVLFEPDELMLVHGSPVARRKYIDQVIASVTPGYATTLRAYERITAQRNRLLKSPDARPDEFFVWDIMLAEHADRIVRRRREIITEWNEHLSPVYSSIAAATTAVDCRYLSSIAAAAPYKQTLIEELQQRFARDRLIGTTTVGPHRDDIEFRLNQRSFVQTASRGEVRSLLLTLKYVEAHLLQTHYHHPPLLLFDDVFSELDTQRQKHIISYGHNQVIVTSTNTIKIDGIVPNIVRPGQG